MDSKLSYEMMMLQRNKIVSGFLVQHIQSCMYTNEFAPSLGSSGLDLSFLPYNAKILATSEQGIMVFRTPDPANYKKDLYHVCKPATKQVWVLPSPQGYYTLYDKFALVVMSVKPLHYKIIRLIDRPDVRLSGESYTTYRCNVFDSATWRWRSLEHVKLEDGVFLSNSLPVTNGGSVYTLLEDNNILKFDAHSERWKVILSPVDQYYESTDTSRPLVELVKYGGMLGLACKPLNGCWEIWVLKKGKWENVYVLKDKEGEIGSLSAFYDSDTSVTLDYDTLKFYKFKHEGDNMIKKVVLKDIPYQSFSFRSDFEYLV